jgi:hypothetical protein
MKPAITSKRCPGCCKEEEALPVEEFYHYGRKDTNRGWRISYYCKKCHPIKMKIWYEKKCGREPTVCFPNDRVEVEVARFNTFDFIPPVKERMVKF